LSFEPPTDYAERVYAGVLGKVIGVYLGRPFEGWTYERIQERLGDIEYYVHDKLNVPLIVTDDDISGTFTFLRALDDYGATPDITARDIGRSWLNYLIENRTILWWGGMGNSTEHTAFLRMKHGIEAPMSGSEALNGKVVAEQIGAQIFIDGWAMVAPGDPDLAARMARQAAMVSHDGEAVNGAVVLAVMESMAFVEPDINRLIDKAMTYIPHESVIARLINDVRKWHAEEPDWRATRELLAAHYGYDKYGGNCHIVPNHGLIIHSLLHGNNDFSETMKIINTCGWDTDCNSGNVGCLMGIKNGLTGIDAGLNDGLDWRGPIADRIYIPTAEGSRGISDCATEAVNVIQLGQRLAGQKVWRPRGGAQFHFSFPGSVQGFTVTEGQGDITNVELLSSSSATSSGEHDDGRALLIAAVDTTHFGTPVFAPDKATSDYFEGEKSYALLASPRIHAGQVITSGLQAVNSSHVSLYVRSYGKDDEVDTFYGDSAVLAAGETRTLEMCVPADANPVFEVGVRIEGAGIGHLEWLRWDGTPDVVLKQPAHSGSMWRRAWVNGIDSWMSWTESFRLVQNEGIGLIMQGTREWRDYTVSADVRPHLAERAGVAARVQGMRRYYALLLKRGGTVQLVERLHDETVLAEEPFAWTLGEKYELSLTVSGSHLTGSINGAVVLEANSEAFADGAVGLVIEEGRMATHEVRICQVKLGEVHWCPTSTSASQ